MTGQVMLTDIEGTTAPKRFVLEVLFPYARERLREWVLAHAREPDVAGWIYEVSALSGASPWDIEACIHALLDWMDADLKLAPLKAIQGRIWSEGYESGEITSVLYADVPAAFEAWRGWDARVAVFSSGSVQAQRLLFRHSDAGDLEPGICAWFDTRVGAKRDPASYEAIALKLGVQPAAVMFLSDTIEELDAAAAAGMRTVHVARDEEGLTSDRTIHPRVSTLLDVEPGARLL